MNVNVPGTPGFKEERRHLRATVPPASTFYSRHMGYDIYVDGECTDCLGSATEWDAAATWIKKQAPPRTPLRRLAEEGKTDQPHEAAAMLADLLKNRKTGPHVRHTLRPLHQWLLKSHHQVMISDGVIYEL